mgnify:CR=1 FL=1
MLYRRFARARWLETAVAGLSLLARDASAVQWDFRQVYCGKQHLGTMFVNKDAYQAIKTTAGKAGKPVGKDNWLGGVQLQAGFAPLPNCNDQYTVAPLIGWKWGYEIVYKDQGQIGVDEPDDFTVTPLSLEWTTTPSDTWKKAISKDTKYGSKDKQDYWDISLGDCTGCADTPEPASVSCLAMGLIGLLVPCKRRRFMLPLTGRRSVR